MAAVDMCQSCIGRTPIGNTGGDINMRVMLAAAGIHGFCVG
eukprot:CAMPEP_0198130274 /NCGR_PEP_ID=MMETSP1442-20131203/53542_1 /TAXON_ID= /ORGANISM="Craspedostauros australis, Strain CCMP3328" /LENGTH=40 /DNA_ID= /DNA_START= /DNA_END= /DNA_ORIENTATION=